MPASKSEVTAIVVASLMLAGLQLTINKMK